MLDAYEIQLLNQSHDKIHFNHYRKIYFKLYNKKAATCDCDSGTVYNAIVSKYNSNKPVLVQNVLVTELQKPAITPEQTQQDEMKNQNQTKDKTSGKFQSLTQSVPEPVLTEKEQFLKEVKKELYDGFLDIERITKAYHLITGNDNQANLRTMKIAIINYES